MRLVEIALFLAPFIVFAAWRMTTPLADPSPRLIAASVVLLVLLLGTLLWLHREGAVPAGQPYVPARLQDGRIVPAHGGSQ